MKRLEADVRIILEAARIGQSQFPKLIGVNLRTLHASTRPPLSPAPQSPQSASR